MKIPRLIKVKQYFGNEKLQDISGTVRKEILASGIGIKPGARIAIASGSRGVANINIIVKAAVETVREMGGQPFIVPAMGSHGGATAQGQREVLESYGITEEFTGAPIKSSMEVVELPSEGLANKVYMDRNAFESDGIIPINRIKIHTDFHGTTESGLMKMLVIGLGKHKQALAIHRFGTYGLKELIPITAREVLKSGKILLGIGAVENAYDETLVIKALRPEVLEQEEIKLLEFSRTRMPSLPVDKLDVLVVDRFGKNISGTGMDTNIIGRIRIRGEKEPEKPDITNIVVSDLTEESHGNAVGMGLADIATVRFREKIDFKATYENAVTSTFNERGKLPMIADNDRKAIEIALRTCGPVEPDKFRIIRIKDTLHLGEMYVSEAVLEEIRNRPNIEIGGEFVDILDENHNLIKF